LYCTLGDVSQWHVSDGATDMCRRLNCSNGCRTSLPLHSLSSPSLHDYIKSERAISSLGMKLSTHHPRFTLARVNLPPF
jgi:hypothetical protein